MDNCLAKLFLLLDRLSSIIAIRQSGLCTGTPTHDRITTLSNTFRQRFAVITVQHQACRLRPPSYYSRAYVYATSLPIICSKNLSYNCCSHARFFLVYVRCREVKWLMARVPWRRKRREREPFQRFILSRWLVVSTRYFAFRWSQSTF